MLTWEGSGAQLLSGGTRISSALPGREAVLVTRTRAKMRKKLTIEIR